MILQILDSNTYDVKDVLIGSVARLFCTTALIFLGQSLRFGKAGPIQAIDNQKSTWTTLIFGVAYHQWPNMIQIIGMIIGFIGINVFIFGKDEKDSEKIENKEEGK